ncbi:MAG TPA: tripartite tricarboxylate transporter substrate binding protein [Burkholderiales bacterium]|nr:tripartite tricarboxylate transporter substrate binding protein [Burkholderiales bacterium]
MKPLWKTLVTSVPLAVALAVPPGFAQATFPDKPVRFIVPFPPGGGTDAFARIVGAKLAEAWGQQVVVDNRAGAQGNIGTALGAKAPADGYTITLAHQGALSINPHLYSNTGYDTLRDFAAISRGMETASVLVVHPSVPATTMQELAQLASERPGVLTFASTASLQQLLGELFKLTTGTNIVHVPYRGAGPAVNDLLSGNISMMFANPTSTVAQVKAGKLRALAILGTQHNEALPAVPTAVEAGFPQFSDAIEWYGVVAPAATPREIVVKLNAAVVRALKDPEVAARLSGVGQTPSPSTPEEFAAQIRSDHERWGKVVKASGAKAE